MCDKGEAMDQETLYTASKWEILKMLERGSRSPLEIAQRSGLSIANVSQQLRLLEMASLVTSQRISNRDKGQPRVLYSLAGNNCYVISTADSFVEKRRLDFSESNQIVMKIWFLEQAELRSLCEKAFWKVEDHLPDIRAIMVDADTTRPLSLYILPREGRLPIEEFHEVHFSGQQRKLVITQTREEALQELAAEASLVPLYDPERLFE